MRLVRLLIISIAILALQSCRKDNSLPASNVPNGDFENWDSYNRLLDWKTPYNPFSSLAINTYVVQKTTDAYNGKYAAKLIYNGGFPATADTKFAVTAHPSNLTGYVKCHVTFQDTVSLKIRIYYKNAVVDSGQWLGTVSIPNYQKLAIPISKNSAQADSVMISLKGGHVILLTNIIPNNDATILWVDYLNLH